jgi:acyl-CoA dehydrogenase
VQAEPTTIDQVARTAERFADRHFADDVLDIDHEGRGPSKETLDRGAEAGFHTLVLPEHAGGAGLGMPELCTLVSSLAERCAGHAMVFGVQAAVLGALHDALGPDAALSVGGVVPESGPIGVGLAEPDGDRGFETELVVRADGETLRFDGFPGVAINAGEAARILMLGRDPSGAANAVLVDIRGLPFDLGETLGLRAMPMVSFRFDGQPVEDGRRVANGEPVADLFRALSRNLCLVSSAAAVGVMTKACAVAVEYAAGRYQGGKVIIEHSHLADLIGRMRAEVATARTAGHAASETRDDALIIATKLRVTLAAVDVCTDAVQVLGGNGYMRGFGLEKAMRDAAVLSLIPFSNCRAGLLLTAVEKRRLRSLSE